MRTLCCKDHPIMYRGQLAYVCSHSVPRVLIWPDGFFVLDAGKKVEFQSLLPDGETLTEAFGYLTNFK